jgi:hypothetical protein
LKILFLSFYFEPDLCAGSFRATAVARALLESDPTLEIDVLTTQPNRYDSYSVAAESVQELGRMKVRRFELPAHRSGMRDQSQAFIAYARQVFQHLRGRRYDAVLATSSRLLTASLGSLVARWKGIPLYLDIRDIFVDTIGDVLPVRVARLAVGPFRALERWTMRRAQRINLVSEGFREYFSTRYPRVPLTFFTNGIDDEFIDVGPVPSKQEDDTVKVSFRSEDSWTSRATISLPVPLSPRISTVMSSGATSETKRRTSAICGDSPMNPEEAESWRSSARLAAETWRLRPLRSTSS